MSCKYFEYKGWSEPERCNYRNETVKEETYDEFCKYSSGYEHCPWFNGDTPHGQKYGKCPYFYWDNSKGWSGKNWCQAMNDEISERTYENYCRRNCYDECSSYRGADRKPSSSSDGCYLTSACVEAMGLADDCEELTTLRTFRDGWLALQPCGKCEIAEYYATAPQIVNRIHQSGESKSVLHNLYASLVLPCVSDIKAGLYEKAHARYRATVRDLKAKWLKDVD